MTTYIFLIALGIVGFISFLFCVSFLFERDSRPISWIFTGGLAWVCVKTFCHLWGML